MGDLYDTLNLFLLQRVNRLYLPVMVDNMTDAEEKENKDCK